MQFSLNRFYLLFIKQWKENKKAYTLAILALPILMGVTYLITAYSSNLTENNQEGIFGFGMMILGGIFSSTLLGVYNPKPKGVRLLTLPVSSIEKLLVAIVYGLIIFPIIYLILVYPTLILANYVDSEIFGNLNILITIDIKSTLSLIMIVITTSSFVLLCSLIYRKFIFIKAALVFISLIIFLTITNTLINKALINDSQPSTFNKEFLAKQKLTLNDAKKINFDLQSSAPFSGLSFETETFGSAYISTNKSIDIIGFVVSILICPVMLIACFYRLKETEL